MLGAWLMAVRIRDLPEGERPRERLWSQGPEALSDRELIALVLRNGRRGESALDLATRLLADFGGLHRISEAGPEELAAYPGVGPAKAAAVVAALQLAGRAAAAQTDPVRITSPEDVAKVAMKALKGARRERVIVLVLDSGNRLLRVVRISEGSVDRSLLPVREILNAVLRHDGRAFAVAHNHPSGDPMPSKEDIKATAVLMQGARTAGLRLVDHLVVTDEGWRGVSSE